MSASFQEMCKLLQIKRINSTAFNPEMQGKVERFCGNFPHSARSQVKDWLPGNQAVTQQ
jgi:transposase InsO family protein